MLWNDVGKDPSGIDGYSFVWDNSPSTVPDSYKEVEESVHDIQSPALSPGKWYFHIRARDNALNWNASAAHFGPICIGSAPDTTPPTISDVSVTGITDNLAVISWSTNEPADSSVEYGSTDNYGLKGSDAGLVLGHSVTLTGLSSSFTYHFRVGSRDASGNGPSLSGDFSFKTLAAPDKEPPVISNVKVGGITDRVAVVSWETDEPADSAVDYGIQASYGSVKSESSFVPLHELTISGLESSTTYHFRVRSKDATGNGPSMSIDYIFNTTSVPDRTPPQISNARVEGVTESTATVLWDTDELSDSFVEYGLSSSYGLSSADKSFTTHHSLPLQGLSADKSYNYRVMSADSSGNTGIGTDMTFRTAKTPAKPDTTPPQISAINVSGITNMRAVVMWTTDELADSAVEYGRASDYGLRSSDPSVTMVHSIVLENLNASTTYHFRVKSTDVAGNGPSVSADKDFRTIANPDNSAPKMSNIKVAAITNNSANITWTTDEPSTSVVDYGTNGTLYGKKLTSQVHVLQHSVQLTGLLPGTLYHFRVYSTDPTGNAASPSSDMTFTTLKTGARAVQTAPFPWVWAALAILLVLGLAGAWLLFRSRRAAPAAAPHEDEVETLQMETPAPPARKARAPAPAAEILAPLTVPPPAPLRHIRCPHCRERIPIHREGPHGITCPGCGRSGYYRPKGVGPSAATPQRPPQTPPGAPVRVARCPSCGSDVPIYTTVYPVRITCPGCGRGGVFKGPSG
jgi:ribosomal protein S27E/chitodextrinase